MGSVRVCVDASLNQMAPLATAAVLIQSALQLCSEVGSALPSMLGHFLSVVLKCGLNIILQLLPPFAAAQMKC